MTSKEKVHIAPVDWSWPVFGQKNEVEQEPKKTGAVNMKGVESFRPQLVCSRYKIYWMEEQDEKARVRKSQIATN